MNCSVIVPAAGLGKRMGGLRKTFLELDGRPVIARTLERFQSHPLVSSIVLVVRAEDLDDARDLVARHGIGKIHRIVEGGKERQDSVFRGLAVVPAETRVVLVHDGVRPFVPDTVIDAVIAEAGAGHAVVPTVAVKDTVKRVDEKGFVVETPDRRFLMAVQTPQGFPVEILQQAMDAAMKAHFYGTDEAALVERIGKPVKTVAGSYENIKITTPDDLPLAEAILAGRSRMNMP